MNLKNNTTQNEKKQEPFSSGGCNTTNHIHPYKRGENKTFPQKRDDEEINIIYGGDYDCIPCGEYQAVCMGWEKGEFYKQEKLYLWFEIIEGSCIGKQVFMAFNLYQKKLRPGSKYHASWCKATGTRPKKNDRMSPRHFLNKILKIKVRQVTISRKKKKLEQPYSVVDEIISVLTGGIA